MKRRIKSAALLLCTTFPLIQGCSEKEQTSDFQPLQGGFGVVTKWVGIDSGPGAGLYYKSNTSKPTLIWPFLGPASGPLLFTNDIGFFIGDIPDDQGRLGRGTYFAVQAPGPALDVSEDVLRLWAESKNVDFKKVKDRYSPLDLKATVGGIEAHFIGDEQLPATIDLSWEQISNIIQDVKQTGKQHVIEKPHVVYIRGD